MYTLLIVLPVALAITYVLARGRAAVKRIRETAAWALDDDNV